MTVVADTSAAFALVDRRAPVHDRIAGIYSRTRQWWVFPGAILVELDYLIRDRLGARVHAGWLADLGAGAYPVIWHDERDLAAALALHRRYADLRIGLVDALVMATAERLRAEAIATLDLRHFGAVELAGKSRLWPRDKFD